MDFRKSIPAVLLLTLAVPQVQARSRAASSAEAVRADMGGQESSANGGSSQYRDRRRQGTAAQNNGFSAEMVGLAGEYLSCHARGVDASPESLAAWERFYQSCDGAIRRFAARFRGRGVDVDDCTQEVWSDLMTSLPQFTMDPSRGRFTSWLYTIVRSKATNAIRRHMREPATASVTEEIDTTAAGPAEACERQSDRENVRRAMEQLKNCTSDLSYQVLHLRWIDELSVAEAARTLRLSSGQVWAREHRMKRQLRAILVAQGMAPA